MAAARGRRRGPQDRRPARRRRRHRRGARQPGTSSCAAPALPGTERRPTTTPSAGRRARTRASRRSCTSRARSGTGITTSAPTAPRLFAAEITVPTATVPQLRDLTPDPGRALDEKLVRGRPGRLARGHRLDGVGRAGEPARRDRRHRHGDRETGGSCCRRPATTSSGPRISPDGRLVACMRADARQLRRRPATSPWWSSALDGGGRGRA